MTDADQLARTAGVREASRSLPPREFSLVLTGDTSFGENYQAREEARGRVNVLKRHGYAYTMAKVAPILTESSLVIANLETVVTDIAQSPFADSKGWVHWSDVRETPRQLIAHNIRAVSLANNHTIDYGIDGLRQTVETLTAAGIASFGAGLDLAEARLPFSHEAEIPMPPAGKRLHLRCFAAFAVDDVYEAKYQAYATAERPGTNPLAVTDLARDVKLARSLDPDAFIVTILHWRRDYRWRSRQQKEAAQALLAAGSDLVIGHGSHMMQQIEKIEGRWVAHGLGNFVFNSPGRYEAMGVPPYSLVARLVFAEGARPGHMRLYPLFTNNRETGYQTRFVTDAEFHDVYALLLERSPEPKDFQAEIATGSDRFGHYLEVPLA